MANRRDIKRRINSVISTQKITKAMKLVAAAKFARASHAVNAARPYSKAFDKMVEQLAASLEGDISSPLTQAAPEAKGKTLLIIVSSDRGLCGGLNTNLLKTVRNWLEKSDDAKGMQIELLTCGRKAANWAKKQRYPVYGQKEKLTERPSFSRAKEFGEELALAFVEEKRFEKIFVAYNEFKSALSQQPVVAQLLPIGVSTKNATNLEPSRTATIVEPSAQEVAIRAFRHKIAVTLFQVFLEAAASEQGSRMTAMDSATNNAAEVRKKLTLEYNRVRQAAITRELIEIISGAEAL